MNLFGVSYGTRIALVFNRLYPDAVRSLLLDAVAPVDMLIPAQVGLDADLAFERITAECDQTPTCQSAFPDLPAQLLQAEQRLRQTPNQLITNPLTGEQQNVTLDPRVINRLLRSALYSRTLRQVIPLAISEASKGRWQVLAGIADVLSPDASANDLSLGMMASVLTATDDAEESDEEAPSDNIAVSLLLTLPGMTEDIADAILDWLDEDEEPRPFGAEVEYYSTLPTPYVPKNGPVLSVEELLLVRGVTPTLLFGADANRNGVLDADEQQRFGVTVETAGSLGWAAYLTVHGAEASKRRDGSFRVNVNQDDLELLYEELSEALENDDYATFVAAYRIAGQSNSTMALLSGDSGGGGQAEVAGRWTADLMSEFDLSGGGGTSLTQVLDLVGATVTVGNGDNAKSYSSPFSEDIIAMGLYMPILMDTLTTQEVEVMPGRINLNECPAELLYGIPLLPEEAVEGILETRDVNSDDPNRQFETWPLVEGLVTLDEMRLLTPLVTCGGDVFRAQVVGYFEKSGVSSRAEVIVDATTVNPKIVLWRDLSHLGRGFDLSVLGSRSFTGLEGGTTEESGLGN